MRVLGIDPGIATVGVCILDYDEVSRFTPRYIGVITTPPHTPLPQRLSEIYRDLAELIETAQPNAVAVEELFWGTNVKTAITVGQARGVILLCCEQCGLPIYEYTPLQIKQAVTGYGRADKTMVQTMVKRLLSLDTVPKPDDAADAAAAALCYCYNAKWNKLNSQA